jgi:hypothetical protein
MSGRSCTLVVFAIVNVAAWSAALVVAVLMDRLGSATC